MSRGRGWRSGLSAVTLLFCTSAIVVQADEISLKIEVEAPLISALKILDGLCAHGATDACSGANVLRARQDRLMLDNARCARGQVNVCNGLVLSGFELKAMADVLAQQAATMMVAN